MPSAVNIAVTGHVDHGKSTLIGRLLLETGSILDEQRRELEEIGRAFGDGAALAYLTDQFEEERRDGITIDTASTVVRHRDRDYCLIDTPGHREFLRNTLTGASRAAAALLLIDADAGILEQTRRHAYLLQLLQIKRVITVVNKLDLISSPAERFSRTRDEALALLHGHGLTAAPVVPVSALTGANIRQRPAEWSWYDGPTLLDTFGELPDDTAPDRQGPLRLPVQMRHSAGDRTWLLGRIAAGELHRGQTLRLFPTDEPFPVTEVLVGFDPSASAMAGRNVAVPCPKGLTALRGQVICGDPPARRARAFTGHVFWLGTESLSRDTALSIRCATQRSGCRAADILQRIDPVSVEILEENARALHANEAGVIRFALDGPLMLETFADLSALGRFTLERDGQVIGAGTVRDIHDKTS